MLDTQPAMITRTYRNGNDLIIVLVNGRDVRIEDFFVTDVGKTVLLRDLESGEIVQVALGTDGSVVGITPRSLAQIEDMFAAAGLDIPPELSSEMTPNLSTQDDSAVSAGLGTGEAIALGILGVAVIIAIASGGSDGGGGSTITTTTDGNGITAVDTNGVAVTTSTTTMSPTTVNTSTVFQYAQDSSGAGALIVQNGNVEPALNSAGTPLATGTDNINAPFVTDTGSGTTILTLVDDGFNGTIDGVAFANAVAGSSFTANLPSATPDTVADILNITNGTTDTLSVANFGFGATGPDLYRLAIDGDVGDTVQLTGTGFAATGITDGSGRAEYLGLDSRVFVCRP